MTLIPLGTAEKNRMTAEYFYDLETVSEIQNQLLLNQLHDG